MHARFDQVDKTILGRGLSLLGEVRREHELAADPQRADTSFQPAPGCEARRAEMGLLGRVAEGPCLFEIFHGVFRLHTFDECLRKQLTFHHLAALESKKAGQNRPPKPGLWVFAAGRPVSVLQGYELRPMDGYPLGFYRGAPAAAAFVVVIRELPRERSTLFFRLFGKGEILAQALQDLAALPPDAWEREAAVEPLVALRIQMPETDPEEEERRFLMAIEEVYEQWKQRMLQQGLQQGIEKGLQKGAQQTAAQALITVYEARFGSVPSDIRAALERVAAERDPLPRWAALVATRSEQEIAAALLPNGTPRNGSARPPRRKSSAKRGGTSSRSR